MVSIFLRLKAEPVQGVDVSSLLILKLPVQEFRVLQKVSAKLLLEEAMVMLIHGLSLFVMMLCFTML